MAIDSDGCITTWNAHAESLFGWKDYEAIGRPLHELIIPHEYRSLHLAGMDRFLNTGKSRIINKSMDLTALTKSGQTLPIELIVTEIPFKGTESFIGIARENSEKMRIQRKMQSIFWQTEILSKLMDCLTATTDVQMVLKNTMDILGDANDWPIGHLFEVTKDYRAQSTHLWRNTCGVELKELQQASLSLNCQKSPLHLGRNCENHEIAWIKNCQETQEFIRREICRLYGLRGAFSLPILVDQEVRYIIEFFSLSDIEISPTQLKFYSIVNDHLNKAVALKEKFNNMSAQVFA